VVVPLWVAEDGPEARVQSEAKERQEEGQLPRDNHLHLLGRTPISARQQVMTGVFSDIIARNI
jgi:hypothetical protein